MAQYHSHTTETLDYLQQYFHTFHKIKHIFQEFCASKKIVQKSQNAVQRLRADHKDATQSLQLTSNKKQQKEAKYKKEVKNSLKRCFITVLILTLSRLIYQPTTSLLLNNLKKHQFIQLNWAK